MAKVGVSVSKWGHAPIRYLDTLGVQAVRFSLDAGASRTALRRKMRTYASRGWPRWLVYDKDAITSASDADLTTTAGRDQAMGEAARLYASWFHEYDPLYAVCNEPTGHGPASWKMSLDEFNDWLVLARRHHPEGAYLCAGGFDDGNPDVLRSVRWDFVNSGENHPYGRYAPGHPDPPWYWGDIHSLQAGYHDVLYNQLGRTDKHWHILEWNAPLHDFVGRADDRGPLLGKTWREASEELRRYGALASEERQYWAVYHAVRWGRATDMVGDFLVFHVGGWGESVEGFNLVDDDGELTTAGLAFRDAMRSE